VRVTEKRGAFGRRDRLLDVPERYFFGDGKEVIGWEIVRWPVIEGYVVKVWFKLGLLERWELRE
jgi:hypothetical protein